jgi:L-asparaginase
VLNRKYLILGLVFVFIFSFQLTGLAAGENGLPNVRILATGGTIAGTGTTSTTTVGYTAATVGVEQLIQAVPEMQSVANISGEQFVQIASENMTNDIWLRLGKRVNELLASNDVDGIVITHGTDTLEETGYFLSLVVKSEKPVVLVGSMRPSTAISADGPINIYNAVVLAGSKDAWGKGVLVALNDTIHSAREVTKSSTFLADTFRAPELGALGYIQSKKAIFYREPVRRHTTNSQFDISNLNTLPRVDIVYGYANNTRVAIDAFVRNGAVGIISAGTGNGSLNVEIRKGLADARKNGVIVVRSSRVGNGMIARNGEANDDELDYVASDTLNPQKARVLLMLALTQTKDTKAIQQMFWEY